MNDRTKQEIGAALEGLDAFRKRTERAIAQQIERASIVDTWPLEVVRANAIATSKILAACLEAGTSGGRVEVTLAIARSLETRLAAAVAKAAERAAAVVQGRKPNAVATPDGLEDLGLLLVAQWEALAAFGGGLELQRAFALELTAALRGMTQERAERARENAGGAA